MQDWVAFVVISSLWISFIALLIFIKEVKRILREQVELNSLLLEMIEISSKKKSRKVKK